MSRFLTSAHTRLGTAYGSSSGAGVETAHEPLSYTSQCEWAAKAFEQAGVFSSKTTNIGRSSAAKKAELAGVSEEQIRRAGCWNHDQMVR